MRQTPNPKNQAPDKLQAPIPKAARPAVVLKLQGSGPRGKTAARARHIAAHVSPSPGRSPRPSAGRGVRGEGGRFGSFQFHEPPNPRRGVRSPELGKLDLLRCWM